MRPVAILSLGLAACGGVGNQPPRFLTFNGVEVEKEFWGEWWVWDIRFAFWPGETIPFEVEVSDPEGQEVLLWWPKAPPGFSFPPDARSGTWEVPADFPAVFWPFTVIAQDDGEEPEASVLRVDFTAGPDSGG